ncbi:MAG: M48 family metallopeptidase [Gemmatimonadetes bacterium]|nr:M48 family metallopeptidase [Gemmatimonadota bacterium]
MPARVILTDISSTAWEHPADRAALNTLRSIPGFDQVVRKVAAFFGERGVRQMFLANAVRVGPNQRPKMWAQYQEVLETLNWDTVPELYVTQTPLVNAAAVGFDKPFIVMNSGLIELLDEEEQRDILGHELGHIMSGHTTYTTIAIIILTVGIQNLPFLAGMALLPFQLALMEWYRKAELSADRAGLLVTQNVRTSMGTFLKMAGGAEWGDKISVDAFIEQAEQYEGSSDFADKVWQVINTAFRTHPFGTVRAAEIQRWVKSGEYDKILAGDYRRRSDASTPPLSDDYVDAAGYYSQQARGAVDSFNEVINRARDAFNSAFKGPSGT